MDEDEYRATYDEINRRRCLYEKALNSRVCDCSRARRFNLADREGVSCTSLEAQADCRRFLDQVRKNARFALHLTRIGGPLAHTDEIRVQNGGLLGLQAVLGEPVSRPGKVQDVHGLMQTAAEVFGSLDNLPFDAIIKSVASYQGRRRRRRKG